MKIKIKFSYLGLAKVNFNDYDFHITPVLTFTKVRIENCGIAKALSIEWGHWAICLNILQFNKQD